MNITFGNQELLERCSTEEAAAEAFGPALARALMTLLADASAFENAEELMNYVDSEGKFKPDDSLSISIGSDYRAAFVIAGREHDRDAGGTIVWSSVERLKLVEIERRP